MIEGPIGVIGAGQMGGGIAQVIAQAGLPAVLTDERPGQAEQAVADTRKRLMRRVKDGRMDQAVVDQGLRPDHARRLLRRLRLVRDGHRGGL